MIAEKLEDTNPIVRVITLFLLAEIRFIDPGIQKQIEKKQEDENPVVRKTAKKALRRISLLASSADETTKRPPRLEIRIEIGEMSESPRVEAEIIETPESEPPQIEMEMIEMFDFEPAQVEIEIIETPESEPAPVERRN